MENPPEVQPFFLQKYDYDCGVAVVASVLLRFQKAFDYDGLFEKLGTSEVVGTTSTRIVEFMNESGLKAKRVENSSLEVIKEMIGQGKTCIVMYQNWDNDELDDALEYGHYAIVKKIKDGKVVLQDPAINEDRGFGVGVYEHDILEFERVWIDKENGEVIKRAFICVSE